MEYWEFLLQKEGDQAWLPLESSQVEILEGRYRIMAHTSQIQRPVKVRITQLISNPALPKRRVMKRTGQTNDSGLMVVLPFTWLQAGTWEVHCASGTDESPWEYAVQLRVLTQEASDGDEWFPEDWPVEGSDRIVYPISAPDEDTFSLPNPIHQLLTEVALVAAFESINQAQALSEAATDEGTSGQGAGPGMPYQLDLAQSALMVNQGQMLMVVGQVKSAQTSQCPESAIALRLIDPQSATAKVVLQHAVAQQTLPAAFAIPVSLPDDLNTRLLLGELVLAVPEGESVAVLAVQRFTVTVDLTALFDAIANQAEIDGDLGVAFLLDGLGEQEEAPKNVAGVDLEVPPSPPTRLPGPPPRAMPILLLPKSGQLLPPKIYYPSPHEVSAHKIQLPPVRPGATSEGDKTLEDGTGDASIKAPNAPSSAPGQPKQPNLPGFIKPQKGSTEAFTAPTVDTSEPDPPSPIDSEFRTLNLQERFWTRLNTLAVEAQQAAVQKQAEVEAKRDQVDASEATDADTLPPVEAFVGEVVIYEDPEETLTVFASPAVSSADVEAESAETLLAAEDILSPPSPLIELPEGDLTAGEKVAVVLRVPFHANRLYLKIWITDPQTRTLADEPRQITHLIPDGHGHLEGSLQLTVPLGCLEAWFEAISVDMVTQQESYKTSVSRVVVPANVTTASLDEFEL